MKFLLTGADSHLGQAILETLDEFDGLECEPRTSEELDLTKPRRVERVLVRTKPSVVVHTAELFGLEAAERDAAVTKALNVDAVEILAKLSAALGLPLIHLSSALVFSGTRSTPYDEDAEVDPQTDYGKSKRDAEDRIRESHPEHLILRPGWLFSGHGPNLLTSVIELARTETILYADDEQRGSPTSARALAETILELLEMIAAGEEIAWGTYHYGGFPPTTEFGFATAVVTAARAHMQLAVERIVPTARSHRPGAPPRRPVHTALDTTRIADRLGIVPTDWSLDLAPMIEDLSP